MLMFLALLVLVSAHHARCSVVLEPSTQKGVFISDYCPKTEHCAEGSHVMCMYYNPDRLMGPRCHMPKNVSITPELAELLLEISNAVRSKIALGNEKGKSGEAFPRGYGMFRLHWDSELATFAQVLANQCLLKHDMCRATKKFSDPSQTAGLVRFTYGDWIPITKTPGLDHKGLTIAKIKYAIKQALKFWYAQKSMISASMIVNTPDWQSNPGNQLGRQYLAMIYGKATHMGCGISAYQQYAYYDNLAPLNYNVILIFCNFSARPLEGSPVYETEPPTKVGYTIKCGCPMGMDEDADCLCYESARNTVTSPPIGREACTKDASCKPAIVLLPIFTVENAPPHKLSLRSGDKKDTEMEIMDLYPTNDTMYHPMVPASMSNFPHELSNLIDDNPNMLKMFQGNSISVRNDKLPILDTIYNNNQLAYRANVPQVMGHQSVISNLVNEVHRKSDYPLPSPRPKAHVQNRYFDHRPAYINSKTTSSYGHPPAKKKSIFAKAPTFELFKRSEPIIKSYHEIQPRKDFTKAKTLAKSYVDMRRSRLEHNKGMPTSAVDFIKYLSDHKQTTVEPRTLQNSAEEKVINSNALFTNKLEVKPNKGINNVATNLDTENSKEKNNDKLMNLLDRLEQEVKHIELDKNKKEIFDAKIRKIYGSVVGNAEISPHKLSTYQQQQMNYHTETDGTDIEFSDDEKYKSDKFSDLEINERLNALSLASEKLGAGKTLDKTREPIKRGPQMRQISRSRNNIDDRFSDSPLTEHESKVYELKHIYRDSNNMKSKYQHNMFSDADEIKARNMYNEKEALRVKHLYSETDGKKKVNDVEKQHLGLSDHEDDPLDIERRRFYQDKLDKIVRKAHNSRKVKHHNNQNSNPPIRRVVRPSRNEEPLRSGKSQANPFYVPDRARFLHGF